MIGGQLSNMFSFSYNSPTVSSISPASGIIFILNLVIKYFLNVFFIVLGSTDGKFVVTINGNNFGVVQYDVNNAIIPATNVKFG